MEYLIQIDLSSIKKNPNAGNTSTYVDRGSTISFFGHHDALIDGENCDVSKWEVNSNGDRKFIQGTIRTLDVDLIEKIRHEVTVEIEFHRDRIMHMPEPEYFYNYVDTCVECKACHSRFSHNQLTEEVEYFDCDDYYTLINICPVCDEPYCCSYKYESINDALKRLNESHPTNVQTPDS